MKLQICILLCLVCGLAGYTQPNLTARQAGTNPSPSVAAGANMDSLVQVLGSRIESLSRRADSLQGQLKDHSVNEKFYESELAQQTGLFSLFVFGLFSIATIVNLSSFRIQVKRSARELKANYEIFEKSTKQVLTDLNILLHRDSANVYIALYEIHRSSRKYALAFMDLLSAATAERTMADHILESGTSKTLALAKSHNDLKLAKELLISEKVLDREKEQIRALQESIMLSLNKLNDQGDPYTKDLCAQIRTEVSQNISMITRSQ